MADPSYSEVVTRFAGADPMDQLPAVIDVRATTPANPPVAIQRKFVGASYENAFSDAESFVRVVGGFVDKHTGRSLSSGRRVIDFGAGWGRITRMLLLEVPPTRVYALDVDPDMTAPVNVTLPGVNALTVAPMPPTALGSASMDTAVAFSVFSHLSDRAHEAWARELGRVIGPGGVVAITVLDADFFVQIAEAAAAVRTGGDDAFSQSLAQTFPDLAAARAGFARGEFQYAPSGGGEVRTADYYGWAAAPVDYVRRVWGTAGFRVVEWVPSGVLFAQALVILIRQRDARTAARVVRSGRRLFGTDRRAGQHRRYG